MIDKDRTARRLLGRLRVILCLMTLTLLPVAALAANSGDVQRSFSSPEEARQALVAAVQAKNHAELAAIFGPAQRELEPGDPVEQAAEFEDFAHEVGEAVNLDPLGESKVIVRIGDEKWPFPIPLVKKGERWIFDTVQGREEILTRRIGHNELLAINVCRAYLDAQREYYNMPEPDGDQLPKYAQHLISRPGRHNGLYWPTLPGEKPSPLGPLVAKAKEEGYFLPGKPGEGRRRPFHGYYFKILKKQGKSAPGGKFDYVINGNMVAGHALIAYPSRWGVSGVMTFIVNQRGRVYQKNLGPLTTELAKKIDAYNPDLSWKLVGP